MFPHWYSHPLLCFIHAPVGLGQRAPERWLHCHYCVLIMTASIPATCLGNVFGWKVVRSHWRCDGCLKGLCRNIVWGMGGYDPDHTLMRALAVNLRKNGSYLSQYTSINRMSGVLDENGVNYATCKELLGKFPPTCYKLQWEPSSAVHALYKFLQFAERYGHSLLEHANFFNKLQSTEHKLYLRILQARKKLRDLTKKYDIVQNNLDVFFSEDGVLRLITNNKMTRNWIGLAN